MLQSVLSAKADFVESVVLGVRSLDEVYSQSFVHNISIEYNRSTDTDDYSVEGNEYDMYSLNQKKKIIGMHIN